MNSLFLETSAKTALGVESVFKEVVEKIIDTPELWDTSSKAARGANGNATAPVGMPGGGVDLGDDERDSAGGAGGCAC